MTSSPLFRLLTLAAVGVALAVALTIVLTPRPSQALFHFAVINEVMTSYNGDPDVQFVEIRMLTSSQNFVQNSVLGVFDADGDYLVANEYIVTGNVSSGSNRPWIMGTSDFQTASGLTPDFTIPPNLLTGDGMVCWGAPGASVPDPGSWDHTNPNNYVDCLAYGTYTGPTNNHIGTPTPLDADGHSLQRLTDTNDNETDFACGDPADPTNNAFSSASMPATTACPGGDSDGDGVADEEDNCPDDPNAYQLDLDADTLGDACDPDVDEDGTPNASDDDDDDDFVLDVNEGQCADDRDSDGNGSVNDGCPQVGATAESGAECDNGINDDPGDDSVINDGCPGASETNGCGSDSFNPASRPERLDGAFATADDDGDGATDEPLPAGSAALDCDGDGSPGSSEMHIYSAAGTANDQDPCGITGWWSDLVDGMLTPNGVDIQDLTDYITPNRYLSTNIADWGDQAAARRHDVSPGTNGLGVEINILDLTLIVITTPPMLEGARNFGSVCPWPG